MTIPRITANTVLKRKTDSLPLPLNSSDLPPDAKISVKKGSTFDINDNYQLVGNHWLVEQKSGSDYYVYVKHCEVVIDWTNN